MTEPVLSALSSSTGYARTNANQANETVQLDINGYFPSSVPVPITAIYTTTSGIEFPATSVSPGALELHTQSGFRELLDLGLDAVFQQTVTINATPDNDENTKIGADIVQSAKSSTDTLRSRSRWKSEWIVSTDASRIAQSIWSVYDTTEREVLRAFTDGTNGYVANKIVASSPGDSLLENGELVFYDNGSGSLGIKLKDSSGTVRTGTVTLT